MKGTNGRQIVRREFANPLPRGEVFLTPPPKRTMPELHNMSTECIHALTVGWHSVIREVPANHLRQPFALLWNGFVHPTPQLYLDFPEPRSHPISARLPLEMEGASSTATANESEAKKVECFWLP